MKRIHITILSAVMLFFFNCNGNNHATDARQEAKVHKHDNDNSNKHLENSSGLVLNNGEKWPVSETLMAVAMEMSKEVDQFATSGNTDYHGLAKSLNAGISHLINKCELPAGAAHENLHEWLHPYMGMVKELENSTGVKDGKAAFSKIQVSFKTFNQYFE